MEEQHLMTLYPQPKAQEFTRGIGKKRLAFILALFAFLAAAEYLLISGVTTPSISRDAGEAAWKKNIILSINGLETTITTGSRKIHLRAGSVMIVPRKYLVFSIHPLNEILFDDFFMDYFKQPQDQSIFPLSDFPQALVPAEHNEIRSPGFLNLKTGGITRGVIRKFSLSIYEENSIRTVIRAERAELDFKNNKIRLEDASIEQHEFNRVTKSSQAVLKNAEGTVYIPGEYLILHPEGVLKGRGLKIGL
jgi:hypothetical protein